jgi:hypothetical protein
MPGVFIKRELMRLVTMRISDSDHISSGFKAGDGIGVTFEYRHIAPPDSS